jgi:nitroreductase
VPAEPLPDADAVLDALATTRAIRRYRDEPVPEADLARILFAATRAPSGSNRQPFRFVVLRDTAEAREAKQLIGEASRRLWAQKRAADGYDAGSGADASSPKARTAATMQHFVDHFESIPVVVLAAAVRRRPAPEETLGASVYPACQNLLLAARALGYGGVMMMWHALVADELRALLGIPDDVFLAATITLGVPEGAHGPVRRRPVGELVFDGGWDRSATWAAEPEGTRHTGQPPLWRSNRSAPASSPGS